MMGYMNTWAHIFGVVVIDTGSTDLAGNWYFTQCALQEIPRINGIGGSVETFVKLPDLPDSLSERSPRSSRPFNVIKLDSLSDSLFRAFNVNRQALIYLYGYIEIETFAKALQKTYRFLFRLSEKRSIISCSVTVEEQNNPWPQFLDLTEFEPQEKRLKSYTFASPKCIVNNEKAIKQAKRW